MSQPASVFSDPQLLRLQQQAEAALIQADYSTAIDLYEQLLNLAPEFHPGYWSLGLALLLQGQEAEAQTTWLLPLAEADPVEMEAWLQELSDYLFQAADRLQAQGQLDQVWLIRQHLAEIDPNQLNNELHRVGLGLHLRRLTPEELADWNLIATLQTQSVQSVDIILLMQILQLLVEQWTLEPITLEFAAACIPYIDDPNGFYNILRSGIMVARAAYRLPIAAQYTELCLQVHPNDPILLAVLSVLYQDTHQYQAAITAARTSLKLTTTLPERVYVSYVLLRGLTKMGGCWQETQIALQQHTEWLQQLTRPPLTPLEQDQTLRIYGAACFYPYLEDEPLKFRSLQNQLSQLCETSVRHYAQSQAERYHQRQLLAPRSPKKLLKIGYLSESLRQHSVGWLARWLFQYHDRTQFQLYAYLVGDPNYTQDPLLEWYKSQVSKTVLEKESGLRLAEQIDQDEIDILINLDSALMDLTSETSALKPAPVQAHWLGWDASGLPSVDYFIADPYVLSDTAQEHYREKIWRLPETYIAVDGFEVGVPTLRREDLGISSDAVIFFSGQSGMKLHREIARLQLQILKACPNSYLLLKERADAQILRESYLGLAAEESVNPDRLRFTPLDRTEAIHRANLGLVDVVLDTYPYNGATTTLETLWMGVPLVTRVGEQFSARNSYTMLMNVGVSEGIAWSDSEYVEWGVRFGQDPALRQQVSWKLLQSRRSAPLWNGRQFTREMESAYQQMWQHYCEGG